MSSFFDTYFVTLPVTNKQQMDWCKQEWDRLLKDMDDDSSPNTFNVTDAQVTISNTDNTTLSFTTAFIQSYLRKWNPTGFVTFCFAELDTRPQLDCQRGGVAFITADYQRVIMTHHIRDELIRNAEAAHLSAVSTDVDYKFPETSMASLLQMAPHPDDESI